MSRPKALYVIPTESLEEDEELGSVLDPALRVSHRLWR